MKEQPVSLKYPVIDFILPLPGQTLRDMSPELDVSYTLLYRIFRKGYNPSDAVKRRIDNHLGKQVPINLWEELPVHEVCQHIYNVFRERKIAAEDRQQRQSRSAGEAAQEIETIL